MTAMQLEVDRSRGEIRWRHGGSGIRVAITDLADAAVEPESGRIAALTRSGRLLLFERDGTPAGSIEPPDGYILSHFVAGEAGLAVVGQGEAPHQGWPDWHFLIDGAALGLRRAGPAY